MKGKRIDRPWGWEIVFISARLLFITKSKTLKGGATKVLYCLEGLANLTVFKGEITEILLLAPNQYHFVDYDFEINTKEDTMVIEVQYDTKNISCDSETSQ